MEFYNGALLHSENLLVEHRSRVKIFSLDVENDLPIEKINAILTRSIQIHQKQSLSHEKNFPFSFVLHHALFLQSTFLLFTCLKRK